MTEYIALASLGANVILGGYLYAYWRRWQSAERVIVSIVMEQIKFQDQMYHDLNSKDVH